MDTVYRNIKNIQNKIERFAEGRNITLVAVTKTFSANCARQAIDAGILDIAESKIQEALPKFDILSNSLKGVNRHFIGHLQSNKAKKAVYNFDMIQSLDSIELANNINRYAKEINKTQKCLIELKVSQEESKTGASKEKVVEIYNYCVLNCRNILVCGIMTIAPYFEDKKLVRPYFKLAFNTFENMRKLRKDSNFSILSMGMSEDFEIAIDEGSNMVRIGTAIFGERNYVK